MCRRQRSLSVRTHVAEGQYYVPRAYYTIDAAGHQSAPVPMRRLRRSLAPYPVAYGGANANANANAEANACECFYYCFIKLTFLNNYNNVVRRIRFSINFYNDNAISL